MLLFSSYFTYTKTQWSGESVLFGCWWILKTFFSDKKGDNQEIVAQDTRDKLYVEEKKPWHFIDGAEKWFDIFTAIVTSIISTLSWMREDGLLSFPWFCSSNSDSTILKSKNTIAGSSWEKPLLYSHTNQMGNKMKIK